MGIYDQLSQLDKESPSPKASKELEESEEAKSPLARNPSRSPMRRQTTQKKPAKSEDKKENIQTSKHSNKSTSKHVYIRSFLDEKAGDTVTFRLPPELMEKFEEIQSLITINYKTRLKRYEVVVTALAFLFWDFEENGEKSELYKLLIEDNR